MATKVKYYSAIKEINERSFSLKQIKKGDHIKLLNQLMELNVDPDGLYYNDIHIEQFRNPKTNDLELVISWTKNTIDNVDKLKENKVRENYKGTFVFCRPDETIAEYVLFPDGTVDVVDPSLVESVWQLWRSAHPEWQLNAKNQWVNVLEYDKTEPTDKEHIVN